VIALVLIGSISLLFQRNISHILANSLRIMALVGAAGLFVIIVAPFQEKRINSIVTRLPISTNLSIFISKQITRFLLGIRSLQSFRRLGFFTSLTAVIWFIDAYANTIGVRILSQTLTIDQALILLAGLGLSSAIPSTPGYIGVYQFVAVTVLALFGFSRANALAYILISQILNYLIVSFWGLIGLWKINSSKPSGELTNSSQE
jgi:uncharacterized membrane protein YbhN (UPF0104 family)